MDRARARLILLAAALAACGPARLPAPAYTSHEGEDGVVVPELPPPARVEIVGPRPDPRAVWLDGEWQWREGGWRWKAGRWEVPPAGSAWAPPTTIRTEEGALVHWDGLWRRMK